MNALDLSVGAARHASPRSVTILIAAYGAAAKLRLCLDSLAAHRGPNCAVVVLDDGTPNGSIETTCTTAREWGFPDLRYVRREENGGFVSTCNWGRLEFWDGRSDLLLLNSDTEVTPGFLQEMQEVLYLNEKHAVVVPRSNSATIFSVPSRAQKLAPESSYALWTSMHRLLPRYAIMPTAVGFCMLIKAEVLRRFTLFDEIYSPGYNEENDFVCRINRRGYSAVAANWAYVFHADVSSFGSRRAELEEQHGAILLLRYPEYQRKVQDYLRFGLDPVEHFAVLYRPHRSRVLYDLFHLSAMHNGSSEFGLNLLRELSRKLEPEVEVHVGISHEALSFFCTELWGYKFYTDDVETTEVFDLVFKPAQMFEWPEYDRTIRLAPRVCHTLQDIITVRCGYLNSPQRVNLFRQAAELSDRIFTISRATKDDFEAFYDVTVPMTVIYHGSDVDSVQDLESSQQVLVVGNDMYFHKGVEEAVEQLGSAWPVIVLGGYGAERSETPASIRRLRSGHLPRQYLRQLFLKSTVVVYPSHYEGCGLPVLDALALGKPVIVLNTAVNRELLALSNDPNLYLIDSATELNVLVSRLVGRPPSSSTRLARSWRAAGEEYGEALRQMLEEEIDYPKLRARWDLRRCINSLCYA